MTTTNDAAELTRNHEVHIQSLVKALTAQRDAANNATVNALADKAVLEDRLKRTTNKLIATENMLVGAESEAEKAKAEVSQMRVVILNLQTQLEERISSAVESTDPAEAEQVEEEKKPGLVGRIVDAVMPTRS